jgi:guanylate kinase
MSGHDDARCCAGALPAGGGLLFVLSGPSGVGKDALIAMLKAQDFPLHYTVTVTTRPARSHEIDGVHYHFVTMAHFTRLRESGELLEWAEVHGHYYGTPKPQVRAALAAGQNVLLKIDVQGAASVRRLVPEAVLIFLAPPSMEALRERIAQRGTEDAAELAVRLRNAEAELAQLADYDYVVINHTGRLAAAAAQVRAIIVAESCRIPPRRAIV